MIFRIILSSCFLLLLLHLLSSYVVIGSKCPASGNTVVPNVNRIEQGNHFTIADVRLHIFPKLMIPCNGFLTSWRFLSKRPTVNGLHLAVFRETTFQYYELVAETFIDKFLAPQASTKDQGTWVTFFTYPPLYVNEGDVLGYFMDTLETPDSGLAIFMKNTNDNSVVVVAKSASDLSAASTIDVSPQVSLRSGRFPALVAIINEAPIQSLPHLPTTTTPRTAINRTTFQPHYEVVARAPFLTNYLRNKQIASMPQKCLNPPIQTAFCAGLHMRAYYDFGRGVCRTFYGCNSIDSEANNFADLTECGVACRPEPLSKTAKLDPICRFSPSSLSPPCFTPSLRFYYDPVSETCYSYFGCAAPNTNNFDSLQDCHSKCLSKAQNDGELPRLNMILPPPPSSNNNKESARFNAILSGGTRGQKNKPTSLRFAVGRTYQPHYVKSERYQPDVNGFNKQGVPQHREYVTEFFGQFFTPQPTSVPQLGNNGGYRPPPPPPIRQQQFMLSSNNNNNNIKNDNHRGGGRRRHVIMMNSHHLQLPSSSSPGDNNNRRNKPAASSSWPFTPAVFGNNW